MSHNISDRNEYNNFEYAKLRTTQIEAALENEALAPEEIAEYKAELANLKPYLKETNKTTATFRLVTEQQFKTQLQHEATQHPNQTIYGLVKGQSYAITLDYPTVNYLIGMGYNLCHEYEYHPKTTQKLVVFKSDTDIDMILDVQNWDENFKHEVDIAVRKWQNSDNEYITVITEHLKSVGYIFTICDDYDVYCDYSQ